MQSHSAIIGSTTATVKVAALRGHSGTLAQSRVTYSEVVSRRNPGKDKRRESRAELALDELCSKLGYCIPPDERDAILRDPPPDAEAFVNAVLVAEGRPLNIVLKQERRPMLDIVNRWAVYGGRGPESVMNRPGFPANL
jgi:hypothetical protein